MSQKPRVLITEATFSDGSQLKFAPNEIVVFVGPNNAGKSATLQEMYSFLRNRSFSGKVVKSVQIDSVGSESDLKEWLDSNCHLNAQYPSDPVYSRLGANGHYSNLRNFWIEQREGLHDATGIFCCHLSTETRLQAANPAASIALTTSSKVHPIHFMQADDAIEKRVSDYFRQAFGVDLIVHRNAGSEVPLYAGLKPVLQAGEDRVSIGYLRRLEELPALHKQGDGMRSFVGVVLHTTVVDYSIIMIDEPEAFLHPPQARQLGKLLARELPKDRQLFIATHSTDFIQGVLDAGSSNVRIVRIQRSEDTNLINQLDATGVKSLWQDPLLRYSNIFDGLFHQKVVLCEGDADCRFYSAVLDAQLEKNPNANAVADVMFTHCGGKSRMPMVIKALRELGVPVATIVDFDILNNERPLRDIIEVLGIDWCNIKSDWRQIYNAISDKKPELSTAEVVKDVQAVLENIQEKVFPGTAVKAIQDVLRRSSPWQMAKQVGAGIVPSGQDTEVYHRLKNQLASLELFIVEVGELERFVRSIGSHGPTWVNDVLQQKTDLANDPELRGAREFVALVVGVTSMLQ